MCLPSAPAAPAPIPQKQAAQSPKDPATVAQNDLRSRMGIASTILTPMGGMPQANTTANAGGALKTTLGG